MRRGFTLIELLVVIAILAVLAVVVVLTLNPAGLLQESRDANRLQDMATLNNAIGYSLADNAAESLGSANTVYVSIPDSVATSTAGDQCQGLGLLALPSGYTYQCASPSYYRNTNGTGWIPVNLSGNTFGSSLAQLPIDPVNSSSSRHYYTYTTDASGHFETTAVFESVKYKLGGSNDQVSGDGGTLATVYEKGSKFGLEPLDYGDPYLLGLWTFNEGSGTIAYDYSGNNATGSWQGTLPYYSSSAKVGNYAGNIVTNPGGVSVPGSSTYNFTNFTVMAWMDTSSGGGGGSNIFGDGNNIGASCVPGTSGEQGWYFTEGSFSYCIGSISTTTSYTGSALSSWQQFAISVVSGNSASVYVNGALVKSFPVGTITYNATSNNISLGAQQNQYNVAVGLMDDVRIYDRILSASEIAAMYNGGK